MLDWIGFTAQLVCYCYLDLSEGELYGCRERQTRFPGFLTSSKLSISNDGSFHFLVIDDADFRLLELCCDPVRRALSYKVNRTGDSEKDYELGIELMLIRFLLRSFSFCLPDDL